MCHRLQRESLPSEVRSLVFRSKFAAIAIFLVLLAPMMAPRAAWAFYDRLLFSHFGAVDPASIEPDPTVANWSVEGGAGGTFAGPVTDDQGQGIEAWLIADSSTSTGSTYLYSQSFTPAQQQAAESEGWVMRSTLRLPVAPEGLAGSTVMFEVSTGDRRFTATIAAEADGDPVVVLMGEGDRPSLSVTLEGLGDGYHTYELAYEPERDRARLLVDDSPAIESYAGVPDASVPARVAWGAGSDEFTGTANWTSVEFRTGRLGPLGGISFCCPSPEVVVVSENAGAFDHVVHEYQTGTVTTLPAYTETGFTGIGMDVTVADLEGDGVAETVTVFDGGAGLLELAWSNLEPLELFRLGGSRYTVQDDGAAPLRSFGRMRVAAGDLDGDDDDEIVIVYVREDDDLQILVYDQQPSGLMLVGQAISQAPKNRAHFDVAVGDLDGDLVDEVVVAGGIAGTGGSASSPLAFFADLYELAAGPALVFRAQRQANIYAGTDVGMYGLTLALPDLEGDGSVELAVAANFRDTTRGFPGLHLDVSRFTGSAFTGLDSYQQATSFNLAHTPSSIALAVGDALGDGRDEIFLSTDAVLPLLGGFFQQWVFWLEGSTLAETLIAGVITTEGGGNYQSGIRSLGFGVDEIDGTPQLFRMSRDGSVKIGEFTGTTNATLGATLVETIPGNGSSSVMVVGDLNPAVARLGAPQMRRATSLLRPLIVLNAPPTHFDVDTYARPDLTAACDMADSDCFDVNACWLDVPSCTFASEYQETNASGMEMQLQFERTADWAITESGGFTALGLSVEAELEARFGDRFSRVAGSGETITETTTVTARADDQIYAEIIDFDVWEYPVLLAGETVDYVVSTIPHPVERGWFGSKTARGLQYTPFHEVGNVLSYSSEPLSMLGDLVSADFVTVNGTSELDWMITRSSFQTGQTSRQASWSVGASASVSYEGLIGPQVSVDVSGSYAESALTSHTSTVMDDIQIETRIRNTLPQFSAYDVTPFAHWTSDGILVVDYRVEPETGGPFASWWEQNYGTAPDPAFNLPYRLDAQKGFFTAPGQRAFTRDLRYDVAQARYGDVLPFSLTVRNFSLVSTPGPLRVRFSIGDPDDPTSVPLLSATGESDFLTQDPFVAERGAAIVTGEWQIPESAEIPPGAISFNCRALGALGEPRCFQVYAVVDYAPGTAPAACSGGNPADCEVRDDNNKAWIEVEVMQARPVPEPGFAILLASGVCFVAGVRRPHNVRSNAVKRAATVVLRRPASISNSRSDFAVDSNGSRECVGHALHGDGSSA